MNDENCFSLHDELCVFLRHTSVNFPGNDRLLQQTAIRILGAMQSKDREKMRRFLMHFRSQSGKMYAEQSKVIRYDKRLMKARDYIERNYEQNLTMDEIAAHVGLSKGFLCKLFSQQLSVTFTNYVNELRIKKSIPMLLDTKQKINEIACQCGFNSDRYYNRTFRKVKGITPGEFRRIFI